MIPSLSLEPYNTYRDVLHQIIIIIIKMITTYGDDEGYKRFLAFLASSPNHEEEEAEAAAVAAAPEAISSKPSNKSMLPLPMEVASLSFSAQAMKSPEKEEEKKESADELICTSGRLEKASLIGASAPDERRPSRRLSLQRSSMTMAQSMTSLNSLKTAAVDRPPRDGQHPDYPFENVVFQGGGAKVSYDEIYSTN